MIRSQIRHMETIVNRLAAVLRGAPAPRPRRLQTARDVIELLQEQVESLRAEMGAETVAKARALGYLANIARKAIETGELSARLDRLEAELEKSNGNGNQ
jgi:hypothetical protein